MSVARISALTFPTKEKADHFDKVFARIGSTYLPSIQSNISIRTDEFTCVVVTVYPDEQAVQASRKGVAEWRDHHLGVQRVPKVTFILRVP